MCLSCTIEEVTGFDLSTDEGHDAMDAMKARGERIPWPEVTRKMRECSYLISALYEAEEYFTGGPLHILTDDHNVEDSHLSFCREQISAFVRPDEYEDYAKVAKLSSWILDLMEPMSTKERAVTVSLAFNYLAEIDGKVFMPRTEFPIREEFELENGQRVLQWGFRQRTVEES